LIMLDRLLNSLYQITDSGLSEHPRLPSTMKLWAHLTYEALDISHLERLKDDVRQEMDNLIARVFCHWNVLLRMLLEAQLSEQNRDSKEEQDIARICGRLDVCFEKFIRDPHCSLGKCGKHTVLGSSEYRDNNI